MYYIYNIVCVQEEKERNCVLMDELAKLELKWKEQLKINGGLKLQLLTEEDRYKVVPPRFFMFTLIIHYILL